MDILETLLLATSRIGVSYFRLPVAGMAKPLLRERVYCYELYHQLRCIMPNHAGLELMAEPVKQGNPSFTDCRPIPDFIWHEPGSHVQNSAVIEVECRVNRKHLSKDLRTFRCLERIGYGEFILLLFGRPTVRWDLLSCAAQDAGMDLGRVSIVLHSEPGSAGRLQQPPASVETIGG